MRGCRGRCTRGTDDECAQDVGPTPHKCHACLCSVREQDTSVQTSAMTSSCGFPNHEIPIRPWSCRTLPDAQPTVKLCVHKTLMFLFSAGGSWAGSHVCGEGEFRCNSSRLCVPQHRNCDKRADCPDGSDEWNCCKYRGRNWSATPARCK
jgi:hypothetical protein